MFPKHFPTEAAAQAAIDAAIRSGRVQAGYVAVDFSGPGGRAAYRAHCRFAAGFSRCL